MPVLTEETIQAAATARPARASLFDQLNQNLNLGMSGDQAALAVAASEVATALRPLINLLFSSLASLENSPLSKDEVDYLREKYVFVGLLPSLVATHFGQYVAIHDGQVVDADRSQRALVRRFFERFGNDASVYIGFVGSPSPVARVPTPFFRHSG